MGSDQRKACVYDFRCLIRLGFKNRADLELHLIIYDSLRPPAKAAVTPRPMNTLPVTKRSQSR